MILYTLSVSQLPLYRQASFLTNASRIDYTPNQLIKECGTQRKYPIIFIKFEDAQAYVNKKHEPTSIPHDLFVFAIYEIDAKIATIDDIAMRKIEEYGINHYQCCFEEIEFQLVKAYLGNTEFDLSNPEPDNEKSCSMM